MTPRTAYRSAVAIALGATLVLVYGIGALGVIGAAGDPADLMYLAVLAVGIVGALLARFRPRGMAAALAATGLAQALVAVIALVAGLGGTNPRVEIVGLNGMFIVLFLASAWLFQRAAGTRTRPDGGPA